MRCQQKQMKPGDVFPVNNSFSYALPKGLKEGSSLFSVE